MERGNRRALVASVGVRADIREFKAARKVVIQCRSRAHERANIEKSTIYFSGDLSSRDMRTGGSRQANESRFLQAAMMIAPRMGVPTRKPTAIKLYVYI